MSRGPTSKDVARLAGVSQSTVSYVMSGKRSISADTLERVEEAMVTLNYQPHAGARALAGSRTHTIAVVMPFDSDYAAAQLMAFVEEFVLAARRHDCDVLLVTAGEGLDGLRRITGQHLCDAAVVMQVATDDERANAARDLDFPVMFIGVPDNPSQLACVDFDFTAAGKMLVNELAALNNNHICVLGWTAEAVNNSYNYIARFRRGAQEAAEDCHVTIDWHLSPAEGSFASTVEHGLHQDGQRTGILMAKGIASGMRILAAHGYTPGLDTDVVALCTEAEAEEQSIPLTAVSTHPRDVSRRVAARLFSLIERGEAAGELLELVPAELIRRQSTRPQ